MRTLLTIIAVILASGCASTNSLNTEWKESIAQLQITPVMPLRENLAVGEVYRYLKKPKEFYSDGQVEPSVAFSLNLSSVQQIKGNRIWPTFSFSGSSTSSISAASEAAGILSANLETTDTLNLTFTDGFSMRVSSVDVLAELCNVRTDADNKPSLTIKEIYKNQIRLLGALTWTSGITEYTRNVVYLRIPTEVYFATKVNVTAHKTVNSGGTIEIPDASQLTAATGNISVAINSEKTVSLVEEFAKPMAIGYRGILLRVWTKTMKVDEFPEDAGSEIWSDL